jgi:hypothetical protein
MVWKRGVHNTCETYPRQRLFLLFFIFFETGFLLVKAAIKGFGQLSPLWENSSLKYNDEP